MHKSSKRYMKHYPEELEELSKMEYNLDYEQWMRNWKESGGSEHMGDHIWKKFHAHDHSFVGMFGYLDTKNQKLATKTLNRIMKERKKKREEFLKKK